MRSSRRQETLGYSYIQVKMKQLSVFNIISSRFFVEHICRDLFLFSSPYDIKVKNKHLLALWIYTWSNKLLDYRLDTCMDVRINCSPWASDAFVFISCFVCLDWVASWMEVLMTSSNTSSPVRPNRPKICTYLAELRIMNFTYQHWMSGIISN